MVCEAMIHGIRLRSRLRACTMATAMAMPSSVPMAKPSRVEESVTQAWYGILRKWFACGEGVAVRRRAARRVHPHRAWFWAWGFRSSSSRRGGDPGEEGEAVRRVVLALCLRASAERRRRAGRAAWRGCGGAGRGLPSRASTSWMVRTAAASPMVARMNQALASRSWLSWMPSLLSARNTCSMRQRMRSRSMMAAAAAASPASRVVRRRQTIASFGSGGSISTASTRVRPISSGRPAPAGRFFGRLRRTGPALTAISAVRAVSPGRRGGTLMMRRPSSAASASASNRWPPSTRQRSWAARSEEVEPLGPAAEQLVDVALAVGDHGQLGGLGEHRRRRRAAVLPARGLLVGEAAPAPIGGRRRAPRPDLRPGEPDHRLAVEVDGQHRVQEEAGIAAVAGRPEAAPPSRPAGIVDLGGVLDRHDAPPAALLGGARDERADDRFHRDVGRGQEAVHRHLAGPVAAQLADHQRAGRHHPLEQPLAARRHPNVADPEHHREAPDAVERSPVNPHSCAPPAGPRARGGRSRGTPASRGCRACARAAGRSR